MTLMKFYLSSMRGEPVESDVQVGVAEDNIYSVAKLRPEKVYTFQAGIP